MDVDDAVVVGVDADGALELGEVGLELAADVEAEGGVPVVCRATGGTSSSDLRSLAAKATRPQPSSTIPPITPGKRRLRCLLAADRPPAACGARATFLEEEALPIRVPRVSADGQPPAARTRARRTAPRSARRRRPARPSLDERPAGRGPSPGPLGVVEQRGQRLGERLGVVGRHRQARPGPLDHPGHLGALVDAGHAPAGPRPGSSTSSTARSTGPGPGAAARRGCRRRPAPRAAAPWAGSRRTARCPGPRPAPRARRGPTRRR